MMRLGQAGRNPTPSRRKNQVGRRTHPPPPERTGQEGGLLPHSPSRTRGTGVESRDRYCPVMLMGGCLVAVVFRRRCYTRSIHGLK